MTLRPLEFYPYKTAFVDLIVQSPNPYWAPEVFRDSPGDQDTE